MCTNAVHPFTHTVLVHISTHFFPLFLCSISGWENFTSHPTWADKLLGGRSFSKNNKINKIYPQYYVSHSWNVQSLSVRVKMLQFKAAILFFLKTIIAFEEVAIIPWLIKQQKCQSFFIPQHCKCLTLEVLQMCTIKRFPSLSDRFQMKSTICSFHLGLSLLLYSGVKLQWSDTIKFHRKMFDMWHRNVQFVTMFVSIHPAWIMSLPVRFVDNSSD